MMTRWIQKKKMKNRLKRLKQQLAEVKKRADALWDIYNETEDLDDSIDLRDKIDLLEEQEEKLEIAIQTETDVEETQE